MALDVKNDRFYQAGMVDSYLKALRLKAGLSQEGLAKAAGTSQPQIRRLEIGERSLTKRWAERLAPHLSISAVELLFEAGDIPMMKIEDDAPGSALPKFVEIDSRAGVSRPLPFRENEHQLVPVYPSAEGGEGSMVLPAEPMWVPRPNLLPEEDWLYGVVIEGESMGKLFRAGDTAWLHPRHKERRDEPCVFRRHNEETGEVSMTIKWLKDFNTKVWKVEQFNPPKSFELSRSDWPECYRVLGKKNR